jgi:hypothetical protein
MEYAPQVCRVGHLVVTLNREGPTSYEVLIEVDTDEAAAAVDVHVFTAADDVATLQL